MHSMGGNGMRERLKKELVSSDASPIVLLSVGEGEKSQWLVRYVLGKSVKDEWRRETLEKGLRDGLEKGME